MDKKIAFYILAVAIAAAGAYLILTTSAGFGT